MDDNHVWCLQVSSGLLECIAKTLPKVGSCRNHERICCCLRKQSPLPPPMKGDAISRVLRGMYFEISITPLDLPPAYLRGDRGSFFDSSIIVVVTSYSFMFSRSLFFDRDDLIAASCINPIRVRLQHSTPDPAGLVVVIQVDLVLVLPDECLFTDGHELYTDFRRRIPPDVFAPCPWWNGLLFGITCLADGPPHNAVILAELVSRKLCSNFVLAALPSAPLLFCCIRV